MNRRNTSVLSIYDTNALKGIAIILMLIHHLFWIQNGLYDDIHILGDHYLANEIGKMAKVCVTIFVFLSGYGLAMVAEKSGGMQSLKSFYFHRFKKLFLNYWFIWLLFVPISILVFGYTFKDAYHSQVILHLLTDLVGLHTIIYEDVLCYNPTWWFYSCIIILYVLFPFLYRWVKKDALSAILGSIALSFLPVAQLAVIQFNILAFVLGILFVVRKMPPPSGSTWTIVIISALLVLERNITSYPIMVDCFISAALVQVYRSVSIHRYVSKTLSFIGKHSMNIFLFHTFIFYFWFQNIVYASRNPIIIFFTLLAICIPISMALEWIKKYTIYKL